MRAGRGPGRAPRAEGWDPGDQDPPRRWLRAHCGPARPRLLPARGPKRTAPRGPDPRALGQAAGPRRAQLCPALFSAAARPKAGTRGTGLGAAGAAAGVPGAPGRRDAFGGGRSEMSCARGRPWGLERGGGGSSGLRVPPGAGCAVPTPTPAARRGGGGTCSAPAPPRGFIRAGGARCAPGRVETASAAGPPWNQGFWRIFPQILLETRVRRAEG